ncbi:MAG TPA: ferritin-like domain-containing protein [Oscillatoriaceae cyanobacterium]
MPDREMTDTQAQIEPRITLAGPITEVYDLDPDQVIERLNTLRAGELVAELQYRHHAYMAISLAMPGVTAEFLEHAAVEAKHADMLAQRIQQLGGDPVFDPNEIAKLAEKMKLQWGDPQTLEEMIVFDYKVEREQIRDYTTLIRTIAFHDPTTRGILEKILADTEDHASELRDLLSKKAH